MFNNIKPKQIITIAVFLSIYSLSFAQGNIIMNGATMNVINSAYVVTNDVSLTSTSTLNVDSSTIKIAGSITNSSGVFNVIRGTVEMNGVSAQTIPASAFYTNKIQHLIVSNNVTLGGTDSITDVLSFGDSNKTFATAGLLTLKSTAINTARVADVTNAGNISGNTITGNVKVERYIQSRRAWRLLTAPVGVTGAQTINQAWQEGQTSGNSLPGFGTQITHSTAATNGYDQGINTNPSIKIYDNSGAWVGIPNTNSTLITSQPGYMLFVRGDRSTNIVGLGIYAPSTPTVVRSAGLLKLNDQSFTVAATGFTLVGNPYASPVNLGQSVKTNSTNTNDNFYFWDPKIGGSNQVGGFVNVSWNNTSYDVTPPSPSGLNQYVQSGSAFFVEASNHTLPATFVIKEADKSTDGSLLANRPVNNTGGKISTNLYSINADGTTSMVDGVLNSYGTLYSNSIDHYDAVKLKNFAENISIQSAGKSLAVERKQLVTLADTIFFKILQEKAMPYKLEFVAKNLDAPGLSAFLEDTYLNTKTPVDLNATTAYNFSIANVPGSWNPSRFRIVFRPAVVLPVIFTLVNAFKLNNNIQVDWKIENEAGIKQYELEKSLNGQQFIKAITMMPKSNNGSAAYNWLDENPVKENNYYRVKSIGINGEVKYSSIVKVYMGDGKQEIDVPTNQLANSYINFSFINMPAGNYNVRLLTHLGQLLAAKKIEHQEGSSSEKIELNKNNAKGIYMLEIIRPDNKMNSYKIFLY